MPVFELAQFRGDMKETVSIKGTNEGLVINLGPSPLQEALEELESTLSAKASFFVGGRVALRVGDRPLSAEQLASRGLYPSAIAILEHWTETAPDDLYSRVRLVELLQAERRFEEAGARGRAALAVIDEPRLRDHLAQLLELDRPAER